jgi:hypothetical protein
MLVAKIKMLLGDQKSILLQLGNLLSSKGENLSWNMGSLGLPSLF